MPILDIQQRLRELGRIRLGEKGEGGYPTKLDRFRLTSPARELVDAAAGAYGGEVSAWDDQWQVIVTTDALPVKLPPIDPAQVCDQWYELWSGGGCQRRCDGQTEVLSMKPCPCDPDDRECKPTTRLRVILPDLPGVGVWRLESHGFYAAGEIAGVAQFLIQAAGGRAVPAVLRIERRERRVPGQQTKRFIVPVLDSTHAPIGQVLESMGALEAPARPEPPPALPRATQRVPIPEGAPDVPTGAEAAMGGFDDADPATPEQMDEVRRLTAECAAAGATLDVDAALEHAAKSGQHADATATKLRERLEAVKAA